MTEAISVIVGALIGAGAGIAGGGFAAIAAPGLVKRCLQIAIQELHRAERNAAFEELAYKDFEAEILADHLQGLHEPIYVDKPAQVSIEDLPDTMPSVYA